METYNAYAGGSQDWTCGYGANRFGQLVSAKDAWAGPSPEHAFSEDTSWAFKRQAQIKYYAMLEQDRKTFVRHIGGDVQQSGEWRAKPQISAFYTSFPWPARASIGHSVYLEASEIRSKLFNILGTRLNRSKAAGVHNLHEKSYASTVHHTARALSNRAIFDMLGQNPELGNVAFYRMFQAAHNSLAFRRLSDVLNGVVLFGDLLPNAKQLSLHPMTERIMTALTMASFGFWREAAAKAADRQFALYLDWGHALMDGLMPFLPRNPEPSPEPETQHHENRDQPETPPDNYGYAPEKETPPPPSDLVDPLLGPQPPRFFDVPSEPLKDSLDRVLDKLIKEHLPGLHGGGDAASQDGDDGAPADTTVNEAREALDELARAAEDAAAQNNKWESLREDRVERHIATKPFDCGPVEGTAASGVAITSKLNGEEVGGELFDRNVPLCDEPGKTERIRAMAAPVAQALRSNLYPSVREDFTIDYPRSSGQMDARRLPIAEVSDAVYRRSRTRRQLDPAGRAVLLIAADASASLSDKQMQMCKCLTAAWLDSLPSNQMQVLAAFYHSGMIRERVKGPLVQWVYHPRKTPVYTPREAVRAVAGLPDSGSGAQSDALSLTYMLDEAQALSKGACVYVVLISDCAFNKSFMGTELRPVEEVAGVIRESRTRLDDKLHITLVALDNKLPEEMANEIDAVIPVDEDALKEPAKVAETIGSYVAACIRGRRETIETT